MNWNLIFILVAGFWVGTSCSAQDKSNQKIEKNGMQVEWKVIDGNLRVTMEAPTDGWVAIGLNPQNQLAGSSFMMGLVAGQKAEVIDYYTIQPGNVHPVIELGGHSAVGEVSGWEEDRVSSITFDLALNPGGEYHHHLKPGSEFFMHMAFSQEDDFAHHSTMRTVVKIRI